MGIPWESGYKDATAGVNWGAQSYDGQRDLNWARSDPWYQALTAGGLGQTGKLPGNTYGALNPMGYMNQIQGYYNQAQQSMSRNPEWMDKIAGLADQFGGALPDQIARLNAAMANADPATAYANFTAQNPNIMRNAGAVADDATRLYGQSMENLAAQQSRDNRRQLEQKMANSGVFGTASGAASRAISEGMNAPWAENLAQVALQRSNIYNQTYQPQAGQMLNAYMNAPERQASALQALTQGYQTAMGGYGSAMDAAAKQAQIYAGLGGQVGQTGMGLANMLGQESQQMTVAPQLQYQQGLGEQLLNGGIGIASNVLGSWAGGGFQGLDKLGGWLGSLFGGGQPATTAAPTSTYAGASINPATGASTTGGGRDPGATPGASTSPAGGSPVMGAGPSAYSSAAPSATGGGAAPAGDYGFANYLLGLAQNGTLYAPGGGQLPMYSALQVQGQQLTPQQLQALYQQNPLYYQQYLQSMAGNPAFNSTADMGTRAVGTMPYNPYATSPTGQPTYPATTGSDAAAITAFLTSLQPPPPYNPYAYNPYGQYVTQ